MARRDVASRLAGVFLGAGLAAALPAQLTEPICEATRDRVLPSAEEMEWTAIPWRPTLGTAAIEADAAGLPILLWAMNGHPLGAT